MLVGFDYLILPSSMGDMTFRLFMTVDDVGNISEWGIFIPHQEPDLVMDTQEFFHLLSYYRYMKEWEA